MKKIYLNVFSDNTRAIHTYKKIGFIEEGILKNHNYINGVYKDVLVH